MNSSRYDSKYARALDVIAEAHAQIKAALALHAPRCARCYNPVAECTGHEDWVDEQARHDPQPECTVCVACWPEEATEPYPCPTARALGVDAPSETPGDPA